MNWNKYEVEDVSALDDGDYVVAVTPDSVFMDRLEGKQWRNGNYDLFLRNGVLQEYGHSYLEIPEDLETTNVRSNTVEELYLIPEEEAPEESEGVESLEKAKELLLP